MKVLALVRKYQNLVPKCPYQKNKEKISCHFQNQIIFVLGILIFKCNSTELDSEEFSAKLNYLIDTVEELKSENLKLKSELNEMLRIPESDNELLRGNNNNNNNNVSCNNNQLFVYLFSAVCLHFQNNNNNNNNNNNINNMINALSNRLEHLEFCTCGTYFGTCKIC